MAANQTKVWNSRRGFSIVELMVGMTLFCIAFVMVMGVIPNAFRSIQQTKTYLLAQQLASEQLEQAASVYFPDIALGTDYPDNSSSYPAKTITFTSWANGVEQDLEFRYWFTITDKTVFYDFDGEPLTPPMELPYVKDVQVTVEWNHGEIVRRVIMNTSVARLNN